MKKTFLLLVLIALSMGSKAQKGTSPAYWDYIQKWTETAIEQQQDYGIPASITLAQGLLESGAGQSELAQATNNHFGIKCGNNWMGGTYYYDDDTVGECFRVYLDAAESFKDHSLFLKRPRYVTLFEIALEDYDGWAHRIRECGYATDPLYAQKLINLIEDYHLDSITLKGMPNKVPETNTLPSEEQIEENPAKIIASDFTSSETPKTAKEERQLFFLNYRRLKANGVKYIIAKQGDTYANIAFRLNMRERDLREWNDALGLDILPGERVFLAKKKRYGAKEKTVLWVHPGESLRMIAQREGMQLQTIYDLNGLTQDVRIFRTRQQILIRKQKKS